MRSGVLGLVLSAVAGVAAAAPAGGSLTLEQSLPEARRLIVDGASWPCERDTCVVAGGRPKSQPVLRACQRVAPQVGPVRAFIYNGRSLAPEQLAACNAQAGSGGAAAQAR